MELYATYYCVEDPSIEVEWGGWTYFYFDIFDSFGNVEVGSLDLEIDNIEF